MNAVTRMFSVGKKAVKRVVEEAGEALADYMDKNFRDLPIIRAEIDEQWQYVGKHGQRMGKDEDRTERGDFWLWAAIDPCSKLVFSHIVGTRAATTGFQFMADVAGRVAGHVQITTDNLNSHAGNVRAAFSGQSYSYAIETKVFAEDGLTRASKSRRKGVEKTAFCTRKAIVGNPNLRRATTSHIERVFLTVRQELARFSRMTLAYSKDLEMHKLSTCLMIGVYNLVRKHSGIDGQTPAQVAGVETKRWTMVDVVNMTERYWQPKREQENADKALARRLAEDAVFLAALEKL